jgi:hypothetical protein
MFFSTIPAKKGTGCQERYLSIKSKLGGAQQVEWGTAAPGLVVTIQAEERYSE